MSNSVDPDETALDEPSHLDLCCLQKPINTACDSERVSVQQWFKQRCFFPAEQNSVLVHIHLATAFDHCYMALNKRYF